MFQQTFVPIHDGARKPLGFLFSISLQAAALASLVLLQLFYTAPIPAVQMHALLAIPTPPVSQPRTAAAVQQPTTTAHRRIFVLQAPVTVPRQINPTADDDMPALPDTSIVGTAPATNDNNSTLFGGLSGNTPPPPPKVETRTPEHHGSLRMGSYVAAANIIHQVQPLYPPLARSARVEGTVEFTAVIDKSGQVVNLQLQRGHPLLVNSAREAILQWRYKPTTLNGEPVEVLTTITVNFKLSN